MTTSSAATLSERRSVPSATAAPAVQVLNFAEPVPGFPAHRDYVLVPADASGALFWLQSVAPAGPRFLTLSAAAFFPDYAPVLPAAACVELEVTDAGSAQLYCVVTVPDGDVSAATANLRAPVVVNPATAQACQVVLHDAGHPMRRPLRR